ncbi:MAG: hypothetical protein DRI48_04165 [Chloroflexi bacterium]|nr:MAG: hypothetical protein DRI48_04165 [Chloroflexota bacterium]
MKRPGYRLGGCLLLGVLLLLCGCTADGSQKTLFRDEFDDPQSGWGTGQSEKFRRGYEGGRYFIELYEPNWFVWTYPGVQLGDVTVEADVHLSSGSQGGHFGVLCRHVDADNFYYFAISADGYYAIFKRVDGGDLEVLTRDGDGMVPSPAIKTGEQTNNVQAVCKGDELSLYVNGELLETVTDASHRRGDVGIGAGSGPEGEFEVQFDYLLLTEP